MNTLSKKALPLTLLLALAGSAQAAVSPAGAQSAPAPAPRMAARHMDPAAMTERMSAHLELSQEQTPKVQQINERFARQVEEQRQQQAAAMSRIAAEHDAQLKGVLTEEQYAKHLARKQEMQERRRAHRGPGGPGTAPRATEAPAPTTPPPAQ